MIDRDANATVQLKFRVKEQLRASLERGAQLNGSSLNAEIVARLMGSFTDPNHDLNRIYLGSELGSVVRHINKLQASMLDIAHELPEGSEAYKKLLGIVRDLSPCQTRIFDVIDRLLPVSGGVENEKLAPATSARAAQVRGS